MNLAKYETLAAAVEQGSLTLAAAQLGITQSAVSHNLDSLEKEKRVHPKNQIVYLDDDSQSSGFEGIPDQTEDALNTLIKTESEEERIKYIDRLPDLYRTVARKRLIDGMKYDEIAENMDLELNTVKTRLRRAKQMMDSMRADSGE